MEKEKNRAEAPSGFHMENFRRRSRYTAVFAVLSIAFVIIVVLNVNTGSVDISISEIFNILFRGAGEETQYSIIWKIRLPRVFMAAMLGGAP